MTIVIDFEHKSKCEDDARRVEREGKRAVKYQVELPIEV